jgi:hypothetical protein
MSWGTTPDLIFVSYMLMIWKRLCLPLMIALLRETIFLPRELILLERKGRR